MSESSIIERVIFLRKIQKMAEEEKSNYAKILFQENIISFYVIVALEVIQNFLNEQTRNISVNDDRKIKITNIIEIEFDVKHLEQRTIGQLFIFFFPYLKERKELKLCLQKFVKLRNRITHKMLSEYNTFKDLEEESLQLVQLGNKIMGELDSFLNKLDFNKK